MKVAEVAAREGVTPRAIQHRIKKNPGCMGEQKIGGHTVFPDTPNPSHKKALKRKSTSKLPRDVIPQPEDFNNLKDYYSCCKERVNYQKAQKELDIASGEYVKASDQESEYKESAKFVSNELQKFPVLLKNRLGDELTERAQTILTDMIDNLLNQAEAMGYGD